MRKWNKIQRCPFSVVEWFIYTFIVIMTISYSNTKKPTKHAACSHNHLKYAIAIGCVKINVLRTIAITQRHFNSLTSFFRVQSAKNLRKTGSTSRKNQFKLMRTSTYSQIRNKLHNVKPGRR